MNHQPTRRKFLGATAALVATSVASINPLSGFPAILDRFGKSRHQIAGVRLGVITYSFRDLKDQDAEATLDYVRRCGIHHIELMGGPAEAYAGAPVNQADFRSVFPLLRKRWEKQELTEDEKRTLSDFDKQNNAYRSELADWRSRASTDKFEQLGKMFRKAGVDIYAFKPDAFGMNNSDAEIDFGLRAARALGASHVTLEHPSNDAHTQKLGVMAQQRQMKVGYHGHEQQTPTFWDTALQQSPANNLNLDLGHFVAAGNEAPLDIIRQKHDRILSMHLKDRKSKLNGGANLAWGQGDTPIVDALRMMRDGKYSFAATIELEYQVPSGSDPVSEVKKCVEYCRTALEG